MQQPSIEDRCRHLVHTAETGVLSTVDPSGNPDIRCLYSLRNAARFSRQSGILEKLQEPWISFFYDKLFF